MAKTHSFTLGDPPVATVGMKKGLGWVSTTQIDTGSLSADDLRRLRDWIDEALADA